MTMEHLPSWVENPPLTSTSSAFVGKAKSENAEEARALALLDALKTIGDEIGVDYSEDYYDELYSTGAVSDLHVAVTDEYSYTQGSDYHHFVLLTAETVLLNEKRSRDYEERIALENRIGEKVAEAADLYRNNRDVKAVNALLEAVEISLEGEAATEEYRTPNLLERIRKYLSQIEFSYMGRTKETEYETAFRVKRNRGVMHPAVEEAMCRISYPSLDSDGSILYLTYGAESDGRGIVRVNRTNGYSLRRGTMTITVSLDEAVMARIDEKAGSTLLEGVRNLLSEISFSADYAVNEIYRPGEAVIALALYSYDGVQKDISPARDVIRSMCRSLSLEDVTVIEAVGDDEEEALEFLRENYGDREVIYMIRIGIVDSVNTLGRWYTKTEGRIVRIDNRSGEMKTYRTMQYATTDDGETADEAKALENQIRITAGLVLGEF